MAANNFENMWWAPLDLEIYTDGNDVYYCQAEPWTWSLLSDPKFRIFKVTNSWGTTQRVRYARWPVWAQWKKVGWAEFELAATNLVTVKAYTYL